MTLPRVRGLVMRLIAAACLALSAFPSFAAFEVFDGGFRVVTETADCGAVGAALGRAYDNDGFRRTLRTCSATGGEVESGTVLTFYRYSGSAFIGIDTLTVSTITEPAPDLVRRVSSYPPGEVVVMCAALFAFFIGFRTGMA